MRTIASPASGGAETRTVAASTVNTEMAAIVTIGFRVHPLVPGQQQVASVREHPGPEDLPRLIEAVEAAIERHGYAIALYPEWSAEPARRRLQTVRSMLDTTRLAACPTSMPPLAGGVLAALASAVAPLVGSPGALVAGLGALEKELVVFAWVGSVTGMKTPAPTVWQHLVSLWPTTSFGVSFHPEPSVRRVTEKEPEVPVPTTHRPMCLAIADRDGDARWVREVMAPCLGSPPVSEVPATPGGPSWWGTERLVEAVAYPIDVPVVARRILRGLSFQSCRWCGESVGAEVCPFCGLDRSPLEFAGDAA